MEILVLLILLSLLWTLYFIPVFIFLWFAEGGTITGTGSIDESGSYTIAIAFTLFCACGLISNFFKFIRWLKNDNSQKSKKIHAHEEGIENNAGTDDKT